MPLDALVISNDSEAIGVIRRVFEELGVAVEDCGDPEKACGLLNVRKFDAVIVDCDDLRGAPESLRHLRRAPSNRTSIAFAVVNGITSVGAAFNLGANFVLDKPVTEERSARSLRAAHGLMVRERRRYFRQAVEMPVTVTTPAGEELRGGATNLSDGGLALELARPLTREGAYRLRFTLPATRVVIDARAELAWSDGTARVGFRFHQMHQSMKQDLQNWLADRFDQQDAIRTMGVAPGSGG